MSIDTSLLHANDKANLMTRFSENQQTDIKDLFIFVYVSMITAHTPAYYHKPKFILLTCVLPFLATKLLKI